MEEINREILIIFIIIDFFIVFILFFLGLFFIYKGIKEKHNKEGNSVQNKHEQNRNNKENENNLGDFSWIKKIECAKPNTEFWFNSVLFEKDKLYIAGIFEDYTKNLGLICMDLKGDVIFAKSWVVKDYLDMGFSDINNYDRHNILLSGWIGNQSFLSILDKKSFSLRIKKVFETGSMVIDSNEDFIFSATLDGFIFKLNKKNLAINGLKKIDNASFNYISLQNKKGEYVGLYDIKGMVIILDRDFSKILRAYKTNIYQKPLIDEDGFLYLLDQQDNILIMSKIDIVKGNIVLTKQYNTVHDFSTGDFYVSSDCRTDSILLAITFDNTDKEKGNDIEFLRINKNDLNVMWSAIFGTNEDEEVAMKTICSLPDNYLFSARHSKTGKYGYAIKLNTTKKFDNAYITTRNTVAIDIDYKPVQDFSVSLNSKVKIINKPIPRVEERKIDIISVDL